VVGVSSGGGLGINRGLAAGHPQCYNGNDRSTTTLKHGFPTAAVAVTGGPVQSTF